MPALVEIYEVLYDGKVIAEATISIFYTRREQVGEWPYRGILECAERRAESRARGGRDRRKIVDDLIDELCGLSEIEADKVEVRKKPR